jgi:hypothetical protein
MDADAFFDELYSQFCVSFPCYALIHINGGGYVAESAGDGSQALVILTDSDLMKMHRARRSLGRTIPVTFHHPSELMAIVSSLPSNITHVTFDPGRKFHRRYPLAALRNSLTTKVS